MKSLVVVESPAKAKTLMRLLGDRTYFAEATYGHVRDLPESATEIPAKLKGTPWARLGVNVEEDFAPLYVVPASKKPHVKRLKAAMENADELILATDEDREGESISWHVLELLKPRIPVRRIAFHEITKRAILEALESPRALDENLVRAQEARRILDRLFGYQLSPLLWKKVAPKLSAGRVQSVAVRLCVMRERERRSFVASTYWDAEAEFEAGGRRFRGRLTRLDDRKIAIGKDFDPDTGGLRKGADVVWIRTEAEARALLESIDRPWKVARVESKPTRQQPAPPFTTSSLQQEANRKLGFSPKTTMQIAQRLYEGVDIDGERHGVITYMRTDSVTLSDQALAEAERVIRDLYGPTFTTGRRRYVTKSVNAQEAHEAIRPVEIARTPESLASFLDRDELRLYELVWKRTVASQMADARILRTTVEVAGPLRPGASAESAVFTSTGRQIEFSGYLRVYVEGADDPSAEGEQETVLPALETGQSLEPASVEPKEHETSPPPRYTEASLVKKLEAEGIGRPSTYAVILDTIQDRGYVTKSGNTLVPTFIAFAVTELLERHFHEYVDVKFTARMERSLDEVATGTLDGREHLQRFYRGGNGTPGLESRIESEQPKIDFPSIAIGDHPRHGLPIVVRVGRYGPYLQMDDPAKPGSKVIASVPGGIPPADLTAEAAAEILDRKQEGPRRVGDDPETGLPIFAMTGRFGPYVQLGETPEGKGAGKPKRASLPKGTSPEKVTLEEALQLLSLPRDLGPHPETGEPVLVNNGRYRPYVQHGREYRSLEASDDVHTIGLDRALELLRKPPGRSRRAAPATVLRELGKDPASGADVRILDGRYGPYATDGEKNASLPKGTDPAGVTLAEAVALLREKGKPPKRRASRKAAAPGSSGTTTRRRTTAGSRGSSAKSKASKGSPRKKTSSK